MGILLLEVMAVIVMGLRFLGTPRWLLALRHAARHAVRIFMYSFKKDKAICAITQCQVCNPYTLPCCGQVCERKSLALLFQASDFCRRSLDCFGLCKTWQRVALCPYCRAPVDHEHRQSLMEEYSLEDTMKLSEACPVQSSVRDPHPVVDDYEYLFRLKNATSPGLMFARILQEIAEALTAGELNQGAAEQAAHEESDVGAAFHMMLRHMFDGSLVADELTQDAAEQTPPQETATQRSRLYSLSDSTNEEANLLSQA